MIKLTFRNDLGEVLFNRGGWHLTGADGLSLPGRTVKSVRYPNRPGQVCLSATENPRTITLAGDVNIGILGEGEISRAANILGKKGILTVETALIKRQIECLCTELLPGDKNGCYRQFTVQFLCDFPFFEDEEFSESVIYRRVPKLTKDTVLPAVFSERVAFGELFYGGSAFAEPEIFVSVPEGRGTILISNETTGERLAVSYDSALFSSLKIDVAGRKITDENGVSRLEMLTDDSFFDGFCLVSGNNRISVENSDMTRDVGVNLRYKTRYNEAVI